MGQALIRASGVSRGKHGPRAPYTYPTTGQKDSTTQAQVSNRCYASSGTQKSALINPAIGQTAQPQSRLTPLHSCSTIGSDILPNFFDACPARHQIGQEAPPANFDKWPDTLKKSLTAILATIACAVVPAIATVKPVTMQCLVKGQNNGWIAEQIFFEIDDDRNAARVIDGFILNVEKKPKSAQITENSSKKLVIRWDVVLRARSQTTKMAYRLAYFKGNGKAVVSAKPHGYVDNFAARGRCQSINQPLPTS